MTAVTAPRARWITFAWLALAAGWICLLLPGTRHHPLLGLAAVLAGVVLATLAIVRGARRGGVVALLAALLVTPLLYVGAARLTGERATGATADGVTSGASSSANGADASRPTPPSSAPPAPRPDIAMRTTVTAVELSGAYDGGAAAADKQYKGQRLLLVGMIDRLDPDAAGGPVVTFNAGDLAPVQALGLTRDAAAALRVGQQVILACDGAGAVGGKATVEHCRLAQ